MNMDHSVGCHGLHTDIAVAIQIGVSANRFMMMIVMIHRHFERKAWRTTASRLTPCISGGDGGLGKNNTSKSANTSFFERFDLL